MHDLHLQGHRVGSTAFFHRFSKFFTPRASFEGGWEAVPPKEKRKKEKKKEKNKKDKKEKKERKKERREL